jgi:hypothetical protein
MQFPITPNKINTLRDCDWIISIQITFFFSISLTDGVG